MTTAQEIKNLDKSKIYSIKQQAGKLATLTAAKYYYCNIYKCYIVVTRAGILQFFGSAQRAQIYGKKNKHFKEFKSRKH